MSDLDKKVMETIERRGLTPRPYAYFLARRSVFWTLAVLSVLLGALSVAIGIFALVDLRSTGGRGLNDMPLDDVMLKLPYIWVVSLTLLVMSTVVSIRQRKAWYQWNV